MTFNEWVKKFNGKKIDYDGAYGVQCVDLIKSFIKNVLGVTPQSIGNAIDYWKKRNISYITSNFTPLDYKKGFTFKQGDIIVMQGSGAAGHIAVCNGKYDSKGVYAFDENNGGTHAGMTLRYFAFNGHYKIVGILRPKKLNVKKTYIKILLIGNSYTYYNGYGELLSRLCYADKKNNVIVVRATKGGRDAHQLLTEKLGYKAWLNGKVIKSGSGTLDKIAKIDFNSIGRAGKFDYIVLQNNTTVAKTCQYDVEAFKHVKGWISDSGRFIINVPHYSNSVSNNRLKEHKKAQKECKCSLIDERGVVNKYSTVFKGTWIDDLTIKDKCYHASARGMYLNALCTFAKIFGISDFSKNEKTLGIPLYNADNKTAKSIASDHFKKGSTRANSVTKIVAIKLQYLVSKYYKDYIGSIAKSVSYFKKYTGKSDSIVDALAEVGCKDTSLTYRKKIAKANNIDDYTGTPSQNTTMLTLLKIGKLIKP